MKGLCGVAAVRDECSVAAMLTLNVFIHDGIEIRTYGTSMKGGICAWLGEDGSVVLAIVGFSVIKSLHAFLVARGEGNGGGSKYRTLSAPWATN